MRPLLLLLLAALTLSACAAPAADDGRPRVVATTGPIGDAVRAIAGDRVALTTLLGPGIDPHTYVATEGDIFTFQEADLILHNGLHLEAQLDRVFSQIAASGRIPVVAVAEAIPAERLLDWDPGSGFPHDPHVWHDAQLWQYAVAAIRDALIGVDAAGADAYRAGADTYLAELGALDGTIRAAAAQLPAERRVIVTAHDAFGYFGRAYGFDVEAAQGISTSAEAGAADIQALAGLLAERQIPAMFIESTISPRTVEAVQAAARAAGHEVQLGGELFSDALGDAGTPEGTYIGMMRHNITTIVAALGAP